MTIEEIRAFSLPSKFSYGELEFTIHQIDLWDDATGDETGIMVISDNMNPEQAEYTIWFSEDSLGYVCLPTYEDIDEDDEIEVLYLHDIFYRYK